jgi:hypothetical protein
VDEISFCDFIFLHIGITAWFVRKLQLLQLPLRAPAKIDNWEKKVRLRSHKHRQSPLLLQNFAAFAPVY